MSLHIVSVPDGSLPGVTHRWVELPSSNEMSLQCVACEYAGCICVVIVVPMITAIADNSSTENRPIINCIFIIIYNLVSHLSVFFHFSLISTIIFTSLPFFVKSSKIFFVVPSRRYYYQRDQQNEPIPSFTSNPRATRTVSMNSVGLISNFRRMISNDIFSYNSELTMSLSIKLSMSSAVIL